MNIDTDKIKQSVDLVDLAGQVVELRKVAANEYAGPCPRCGGTDRLHVKADWFFCRQCYPADMAGVGHDAIGWVRWVDGLDFRAACERLGANPAASDRPRRAPAERPAASPPGDLWQARARTVVEEARYTLWDDPRAAGALKYLRGRGLTDDTIKAAGLGLVVANRWEDRADWGLDDSDGKLCVPRGIVLPCEIGGRLWYVKVRRPDKDVTEERPKYHALAGSVRTLYGLDRLGGHGDTLLLCEGEVNALSIWQAARAIGLDRLDVLSFGSESMAGGDLAREQAARYQRVLVWADKAEIARAIMAELPGARGLRSVERDGQKLDANALLQAGALGDFLRAALDRAQRATAGEVAGLLGDLARPVVDRLALGWQWLDAEAAAGRAETPAYSLVLDTVEGLNAQYKSDYDAAQAAAATLGAVILDTLDSGRRPAA